MTESDNEEVEIYDDDWLYRRLAIHQVKKRANRASSYAFTLMNREPEPKPSLDLAKLTSPEESVNRPKMAGLQLAQFQACSPRSLDELDVVHSPEPDNRAHCHIAGTITHEASHKLASMLELMEVYSDDPASS